MSAVLDPRALRVARGVVTVRPGPWTASKATLTAEAQTKATDGWPAVPQTVVVASVPSSAAREATLAYLAACTPDAMAAVVRDALRYQALRAGAAENADGDPLQCFHGGSRLAVVEAELDEACDRALVAEGVLSMPPSLAP